MICLRPNVGGRRQDGDASVCRLLLQVSKLVAEPPETDQAEMRDA